MSDEFYNKWFRNERFPSFVAKSEHIETDNQEYHIENALDLDINNLKPFTKELLKLEIDDPLGKTIKEITNGYKAYTQFQDLLYISICMDETKNIDYPIEGRHYSYYESIIYLKEIISCLVQNNVLAANILFRPFMETSITYLFWKLRLDNGEYEDYYEWLNKRNKKTPFRNMLDLTMDRLESRKYVPEIKYRQIQNSLIQFYRFISEYHHNPKQENSVVTLSGSNENNSLYALMTAFHNLDLLLHTICYLYILSNPNILFPVETHKKFGFFPPLGIFADKTNYIIIDSYIGKENTKILKEQLVLVDTVKSSLEWFNNSNDLTETQLEESWEEFQKRSKLKDDPKDITIRLLYRKSQARALGWLGNYLKVPENYDYISDEKLDKAIEFIKNWQS